MPPTEPKPDPTPADAPPAPDAAPAAAPAPEGDTPAPTDHVVPQAPPEEFEDVVYMKAPGVEGVTKTTRAQFDGVWKERGWEETTNPDPGADVADMTPVGP